MKKELLKERMLEKGFNITFTEKNDNGVIKKGISITRINEKIGKVYYPTQLLKEIETEDLVNQLLKVYEESADLDINIEELLFNKEYLKNNVRYAICKDCADEVYSWNFEGMKGMFKIDFPINDGTGSIKITWDMLQNKSFPFHASNINDLHEIALENTKANVRFKRMDELMKEMLLKDGIPEEVAEEMITPTEGMFVVSNIKGIDGASALLSSEIMDDICDRINSEEVVVIPSSIHEIIIIEAEDKPISIFSEMVKEINSNEVREEEQLSNQAFIYKKGVGLM